MNSQEQLDFYNHLFDGFKGLLKGRWMPELSEAELHVLQDFLWAAHDDVVSDWSRRDMMARSPLPRVKR